MDTIIFDDELSEITVKRLISLFSEAYDSGFKELRLMMTSTGESISDALKIYNYIKSVPIVICVHNLGTVSHLSNLLFLSGKVRSAAPHTLFCFGPLELNIRKYQKYSLNYLQFLWQKMDQDFQWIINTYQSSSIGSQEVDWVVSHIQRCIVDAEKAMKLSYIDRIYDCNIESDTILARYVNFFPKVTPLMHF
ncbi:ATP-dependent Clp protease proteolytic subunit [Scandinavium sp. TWS1a]|uniref:ATP-dependent Clp protease proteolytic subunit n=1 Tax=Scandinavium tedordense TaxID=2926521 RepID=UPI0021661B52|nr:ATP-dependent Clp protease proteolytic subunit [Scandinavium tedordense]MCS2169588.1 ATP-dependent Clp protease proteolytic subunit [Scandinavium tedordense]